MTQDRDCNRHYNTTQQSQSKKQLAKRWN